MIHWGWLLVSLVVGFSYGAWVTRSFARDLFEIYNKHTNTLGTDVPFPLEKSVTHYPGHHINAAGEFQSDKHPDLPPDRVRLNILRPENWPALLLIADAYQEKDAEFADDLRGRIEALKAETDHSEHGRGIAGVGPDDPDCGCRGHPLEVTCAEAGCGFCLVAQRKKRLQK